MKKILMLVLVSTCIIQAQKKAIVIGASAGMGRETAKLLSKEGYTVGLVARRKELLVQLQKELSGPSHIKVLDVTDVQAREHLGELIEEMGGLDLMVIAISANFTNLPKYKPHYHRADIVRSFEQTWEEKERYLNIDAKGFIAMADIALHYFAQQNHGHLAGISSTSGLRGVAYNPEYSAAKACISYYMEAMRNYMVQNNINVSITDIVPGYVAVEYCPIGTDPMAYWEISVEEAGKVILEGIKKKKKVIYVPGKVWFIAMLLKGLPDYMYNKFLYWI